jgi:hypothetical protein
MRVLCADAVESSLVADLEALGHEVVVDPKLEGEALTAAIAGHEVLVVRSTKVGAATIEAGEALRLVVRAGSGVNTIDVAAATSAGVGVANVPGRNAIAVAELTFGLLLAVDRNIPAASKALHRGEWDKVRFSVAAGLQGRTLGILGFGGIGRAVAERAVAFGLHVITLARDERDEIGVRTIERLGVEVVEPHGELIRRCDILTLHVPGTAETRHLIGVRELVLPRSTRPRSCRHWTPACAPGSTCSRTSPPSAGPHGSRRSRRTRTWCRPRTSGPRRSRLSWPSPPASWNSSARSVAASPSHWSTRDRPPFHWAAGQPRLGGAGRRADERRARGAGAGAPDGQR